MKNIFLLVSILSIFIISCNGNKEIKTVSLKVEEKIRKKYPSENFTEAPVKGKQSYKAEYNFETKKIINVNKNSKIESSINELINISDKHIILTHNDGRIISEYNVLEKKFYQDLDYFEYILENNNGKTYFSHVVESDGSFSSFEFRTKDSLNVYLKDY